MHNGIETRRVRGHSPRVTKSTTGPTAFGSPEGATLAGVASGDAEEIPPAGIESPGEKSKGRTPRYGNEKKAVNRMRAQRATTRSLRPAGVVRPSALVVDDDPLVRRAITRQLATTFTVFLAGTLASALRTLEWLEAPSEQLNLAFIDYELPDGTGLPILERLEAWPDSIRVLMSANIKQLALFRPCGKLVPMVLEKPLSFTSIEAAKNAALAVLAEQRTLN